MNLNDFTRYKSGILVPLFTLRTAESPGSGDFLSLIELGQWCVETGLDLIQLLPVNDSGTDPSPYSALSAYALHPLFIRISAVPEYNMLNPAARKHIQPSMEQLYDCEKKERLAYRQVLDSKISILRKIFTGTAHQISDDRDFLNWRKNNDWVQSYAVFRSIKEENESRSWLEWKEHQNPSPGEIDALWSAKKYADSNMFYAWLQYRLEEQFLTAARELRQLGIMLKGDIPILMNDDSVAVWAHRDIFYFDLRAGAPPDMFATLGQNWGFPIYNWKQLEQKNYDWWKLRLRQAAKFYDAYRIDHVLGFFRIWTISYSHKEGVLGYFVPSLRMSRRELHDIGLDDGRIQWLAEPHLRVHHAQNMFKAQTEEVISLCFRKMEGADFYLFNAEIHGEKDILSLSVDENIKQLLLNLYRDRALIQVDTDDFAESWNFRSCSRYENFSDNEKHALEGLIHRKAQESNRLWKERGENLLSFMKKEVDMLCCAEDLGAVPACVPGVLEQLGILGLKIPRWERARNPESPVEPFVHPGQYARHSVCAPSVHDTSTLREWWEYEDGREDFWHSMGLDSPCPVEYSTETAEKIISELLGTNSAIVVFQIQDMFALDDGYRVPDSREERMNIPGTVQDRNWSYRMPMSVADLRQNKGFTQKIRSLVSVRRDGEL